MSRLPVAAARVGAIAALLAAPAAAPAAATLPTGAPPTPIGPGILIPTPPPAPADPGPFVPQTGLDVDLGTPPTVTPPPDLTADGALPGPIDPGVPPQTVDLVAPTLEAWLNRSTISGTMPLSVGFRVDEPATVTARVFHQRRGIRIGGRCVAAPYGVQGTACAHRVLVGEAQTAGPVHRGVHQLAAPGGGWALRGRYTVRVVATDPAGNHDDAALQAKVVRAE